MSVVTETFAPLHQPPRSLWLWRELAPYPGRETMTLRLVMAVVVVTVISMALQTPLTAISAYMVFFVTKENRVITTLTGIALFLGATIGIALSLFFYSFTFDYPEFRIPVMATTVFAGMFLSRVFVIGPLGFVIGFVLAVTQSMAESAPDADALVRDLLWVWVIIVFPVAVTVIINQILLPADPWKSLVRALTQRLDLATAALRRAVSEGAAGGQRNATLLDLATRGSSSLFGELKFAAIKDGQVKRRHASLTEAIIASERLISATAALELRDRHHISEEDRRCAEGLLTKLSQLRTWFQRRTFDPLTSDPAETAATLPELREVQLAATALRDSLRDAHSSGIGASPAKTKKSLFVADAFTNPDHVRFALKVTLAAMSCYIIYCGLDWPGIRTAFITCCFIALESTGATIRKGQLRLIGCALGGLLGFLAIMYLIPHMESIVSLALLTAAGSALAGWVAAGSERISYAGLQIALAFFMCIYQGYAPDTHFATIRNRLVGIVLGIIVSSLVFRYLWPERASAALGQRLGQTLRNLAQLVLIPSVDGSIQEQKKNAAELRTKITKDLNDVMHLSELATFEDTQTPQSSPSRLQGVAEHAQVVCLIATVLTGDTELEEWSRLDSAAQAAELALRNVAAEQLRAAADVAESDQTPASADLEASLENWEHAVLQVRDNDRVRLVRRLVEQIQTRPGS